MRPQPVGRDGNTEAWLPPGKVPGYELLGELGAGGMGRVFRARDVALGRHVAIKFVHPRFAGDAARLRRFTIEARAASSLNHPNIVTVHEVGTADGLPFIVMELLEGSTLRRLLEHGPLPNRQAVELAVQLAEGLAKAHAAGIIHRDLKPENLIETQDGFLKIVDFGLAKLREPALGEARASAGDGSVPWLSEATPTEETAPWAVVGTTGYMSPEQAGGHGVDYRSDQFACGAVLYEMVTGRRAFQRATPTETLAAVLRDEPEPITALNGSIPLPYCWIVERCLAKSPLERYASTLDLAHELRSLREHLAEATPRSRPAGAPTTGRRSGLRWAAAALGAVALGVTVPRSVDYTSVDAALGPLPAARHLAILPFDDPGGDPEGRAFLDGMAEVVASRLTQLAAPGDALGVIPVAEVRASGVTLPSGARRALGATLAITGAVQRSDDRLQLTASLVDTTTLRQLRSVTLDGHAGDLRSLQSALLASISHMLGGPAVADRPSEGPVAWELYVRGRGYLQRYEDEEALELAIASFQQAIQRDPSYALAYAALGEANWRRYELTRDPALVELAEAACQKALAENRLLAPVHATLGLIHVGRGDAERAVAAYRRAIALDPGSTEAQRGLASALEASGELDQAEALYRRAIAASPRAWSHHSSLGVFEWRRGRYAEAEAAFRRVIELTPDNVRGYDNLGGLLVMTGRAGEAMRVLAKSLSIRPTYAAASNLGTAAFYLGLYAEAARAFERALAIDDRDYRVWRNLAAARYWAPGERRGAAPAYEHAARMAEQERAVNPSSAEILSDLADCYAMLGRGGKARVLLGSALDEAPADVNVMVRAIEVFERLGDRGAALRWIERALAAGLQPDLLERTPGLGELRADPRYLALLRPADGSRHRALTKGGSP